MAENNLTMKANLLRLASTRRTGVLQLAKELRIGPARLIALLDAMEETGLVNVGEEHSKRAGRPRKQVEATLLGKDYLNAYDILARLMLKSRRADLQKASADADYAKRLVARRVSPSDLFLELNEIVHLAGRSPV